MKVFILIATLLTSTCELAAAMPPTRIYDVDNYYLNQHRYKMRKLQEEQVKAIEEQTAVLERIRDDAAERASDAEFQREMDEYHKWITED